MREAFDSIGFFSAKFGAAAFLPGGGGGGVSPPNLSEGTSSTGLAVVLLGDDEEDSFRDLAGSLGFGAGVHWIDARPTTLAAAAAAPRELRLDSNWYTFSWAVSNVSKLRDLLTTFLPFCRLFFLFPEFANPSPRAVQGEGRPFQVQPDRRMSPRWKWTGIRPLGRSGLDLEAQVQPHRGHLGEFRARLFVVGEF